MWTLHWALQPTTELKNSRKSPHPRQVNTFCWRILVTTRDPLYIYQSYIPGLHHMPTLSYPWKIESPFNLRPNPSGCKHSSPLTKKIKRKPRIPDMCLNVSDRSHDRQLMKLFCESLWNLLNCMEYVSAQCFRININPSLYDKAASNLIRHSNQSQLSLWCKID